MADAGSPLERARALALRVLAFHARSEAQLRARLARAGLSGSADEVVAWLGRLGYLDDAAFARARARSLVGTGRLGPRMAERRLCAAGIPSEAARAAVAAAVEERAAQTGPGGEPAEVVLCRAAAERRLRDAGLAELDARARARLARYLLGRGFSAAAVQRVLGLRDDVEV